MGATVSQGLGQRHPSVDTPKRYPYISWHSLKGSAKAPSVPARRQESCFRAVFGAFRGRQPQESPTQGEETPHVAMKIRPLHDRVLVRRLEEETKTAGGIIIPDTAKEKPSQGKVLAAGPGARGEDGKIVPLDVKKGDKILFGKWSGSEVRVEGEDLLIMKESDIMGIIE